MMYLCYMHDATDACFRQPSNGSASAGSAAFQRGGPAAPAGSAVTAAVSTPQQAGPLLVARWASDGRRGDHSRHP